jgi:multisubunit Na+/H+ antiporter MnhE subunit
MALCLMFFVLGFLTDKIRIFPFVLGIILGIVLKSLMENASIDCVSVFGTQLYHKVLSTYSNCTERSEKVGEE